MTSKVIVVAVLDPLLLAGLDCSGDNGNVVGAFTSAIRLEEKRATRRARRRVIALRNASIPMVHDSDSPCLANAVRRIEQNTIRPGFPINVTD